jgi:hypothetical protein
VNDFTMSQGRFTTLGLRPSFGFGDRIAFATPGHVTAMKQSGGAIAPIFAQQSIREMSRTGRTPEQVIAAAVEGMQAASWSGATGADADHLKTLSDVDATSAAGFVFYTIDPSDHVDVNADDYDLETLRERFERVRPNIGWCEQYIDQQISLPNGRRFSIDEQASMRCAVKYGLAIEHGIALAKHIVRVNHIANRQAEIELSIDETPQPTALAEHYIIADQFRSRGVKLISLAPRFIGDFEKGVDYRGDMAEFERSLADHASLARMLGPYKLSLHSGSDKLSLYPILARVTEGCFHVKTAGTSYLEALRVAARHDVALFRRVVDVARTHYDRDKATYHVSANINSLPPTSEVADINQLEEIYLGAWADVPNGHGFTQPGRQVLHCTFGTVLTNSVLGPQIRALLRTHADTYTDILANHFSRHLRALNQGL